MIQYLFYFASMFRSESDAVANVACTAQQLCEVENCTPVCLPDATCKPQDCPVVCTGK